MNLEQDLNLQVWGKEKLRYVFFFFFFFYLIFFNFKSYFFFDCGACISKFFVASHPIFSGFGIYLLQKKCFAAQESDFFFTIIAVRIIDIGTNFVDPPFAAFPISTVNPMTVLMSSGDSYLTLQI